MKRAFLGERFVFGLYGAGGFGREVMPLVSETLKIKEKDTHGEWFLCFIDDGFEGSALNGHPVLSFAAFLDLPCERRFFNVAIADSKIRQKLSEKCLAQGAEVLSLVSPLALFYEQNILGEGGIFCAHSVVTSNVKIGRFFHGYFFSYIAHDCVIGDWVTFAPGVHCNGNVHIHDHAYIGTGAILKQGRPEKPLVIGEGAIVGMGAVVTRDVPAYTTVVGNPARPLEKV